MCVCEVVCVWRHNSRFRQSIRRLLWPLTLIGHGHTMRKVTADWFAVAKRSWMTGNGIDFSALFCCGMSCSIAAAFVAFTDPIILARCHY